MDSILNTTFTTNLPHDMREYAPYLDIIKSYFFPGLENRLYEGLEMFIYGDRQLLAQFPSWKQCIDSTRAILRDSISSMLHQSSDDESRGFLSGILSQTINYLMKDGLIACIINSIVLNNRLNKVCRDLDTVGAERDFLRRIHVWNFINENNYWHDQTVQSIRSSETTWHCHHPDHKAQIHGENHHFHHETRSCVNSHQEPLPSSNSSGKLSVCTCGNSSCQCSASETPPTCNQSCSCDGEDSNCETKSLEIVISDGKNTQRAEKSPLPCTSHSLLSIIIKPDASSSPVESENKFIAAINKTCSFVNSILAQVGENKIAKCRLICRIQEDRINFKLQMRGRNGDKTCLYTDRVDVAVRKSSESSGETTVDFLNKTLEKESDEGGEKHDLYDFPAEIYTILGDHSNDSEKINSPLQIPTIVVYAPDDTLPEVENNPAEHVQTMDTSCSSSVTHFCASKTSSDCDTTEEVFTTANNSATNCTKTGEGVSENIQGDSSIYLNPIKSVKPVEEVTGVVDTNTVEEFAEAPAKENKQTADQAKDCGGDEQVGLSSVNESVGKTSKVPDVAEEITEEKQCCEVDHSPGSISSRTSESTGSMVNSKVLVIPLISAISLKACDTRIIPVIQVETPIVDERHSESDCQVCECGKAMEDQLKNEPASEKNIQFDEPPVNTDFKPKTDDSESVKIPSEDEETVQSPKKLKIEETKLPNENLVARKCTGTCERSTSVNLSQLGGETRKSSSAVEGSSMKSANSISKSQKSWSKAGADYGSSGIYCAGDASLNNFYSPYTLNHPPQIPHCRTPRIVRPTPRRAEKKDTCHQYLPIINKSTRAIVSAVCRCLKRAFPHKTLRKVKHLIARKVHRVLKEREKGTNTLHNRVERGTNCWKSVYECQTYCPGRDKNFKTWEDTSRCPCRQTSKCLCHLTSISETFSTPVSPKMSCHSSDISNKTLIYVERSREFPCCCQHCLSVGRPIASPARQVNNERSRTCCCSRCRDRRAPLIADSIISQRSTSPGCSCDDIELAYHRKYRNKWGESSQSLPTTDQILHKLKSTDSKRTKYTTSSASEPHYCCYHKIFGAKNMARCLDSQVTSQRSISRAVDLDCGECFGPTDHEFRTMLMQYVNLCRSVRHSLMKGFRQADTYKPSSTFNSRGSQSGFSRR